MLFDWVGDYNGNRITDIDIIQTRDRIPRERIHTLIFVVPVV